MFKRISALFLAIPFLLLTAACSGIPAQEPTAEAIQMQLETYASGIPSVQADRVSLSPAGDGSYSVAAELTWNESVPRYSTEKALEQYSQALADDLSKRAPNVAMASLSWMVPYHSKTEPAMQFEYQRSDDQLERSSLQDRFEDTSFGADAPDQQRVTVNLSSLRSEAGRKNDPRPISQYMNLPQYKTVLLPQTSYPRHKTLIAPQLNYPRHKTLRTYNLLHEQLAARQAAVNNPLIWRSGTTVTPTQTQEPSRPGTVQANASASNAVPSVILSSDGTKDANGRTVYVTPTGEHWHYDNQCNQGRYYVPDPGEIESRGLTPCEKCVL